MATLGDCLHCQAITVGEQEYEFKANEEASSDVLRLPLADGDGHAEEVAQVRQKLHLQVRADHPALLP